jgi:hypothetical protein
MPARSDPELRALSDHVLYEVQMLFALTERLGSHIAMADSELPWDVEMAFLESFTLHARNLIEFLWPDGPRRKEDGIAADFFEPGEWARIRPPRETTLDQVPERVGREIVHMTYHRVDLAEGARAWKFGQIAASIGRCLRVFLAEVPDERVAPAFGSKAKSALPAFLRWPVAVSFPPDDWPPPIATQPAPPNRASP